MTIIYLYMPWVCVGKEDEHYFNNCFCKKNFVSFPPYIHVTENDPRPDIELDEFGNITNESFFKFNHELRMWAKRHRNPMEKLNGYYITTSIEYIKSRGLESDLQYRVEKTEYHLDL